MNSNSHSNTVSFKGKELIVGIDISKKSWRFALRNSGLFIEEKSIDPEPEVLYKYLDRNYPDATYKAVYEASYCGFWIQRELEDLGIECIVVHPADIPTKHKEKEQKTDPLDARKLARELEKGDLEPIYVPDERAQEIRSVARLVSTFTKEMTRIKNRINSHLDFYGVRVPGTYSRWSVDFMLWLEHEAFDPDNPAATVLFDLIDTFKYHKQKRKDLIKEAVRLCRDYFGTDRIRNILTINGIGKRTMLTILTELIDLERFDNDFSRICRFVGLTPSMSRSGGKDYRPERISKRGNKEIMHKLIEASWAALRSDKGILLDYNNLISRMSKQDAIVRIAKKLLRRFCCIWRENRPYEPVI